MRAAVNPKMASSKAPMKGNGSSLKRQKSNKGMGLIGSGFKPASRTRLRYKLDSKAASDTAASRGTTDATGKTNESKPLSGFSIWIRFLLCPLLLPVLFLYTLFCTYDASIYTVDADDADILANEDAESLLCDRCFSYHRFNCFSSQQKSQNFTAVGESMNYFKNKTNRKRSQTKKFHLALNIARTDMLLLPFDGDWIEGLYVPKINANGEYIYAIDDAAFDQIVPTDVMEQHQHQQIVTDNKENNNSKADTVGCEANDGGSNSLKIEVPQCPSSFANGKSDLTTPSKVSQMMSKVKLSSTEIDKLAVGPSIENLVEHIPRADVESGIVSPLRSKIRSTRRPWKAGSPLDELLNTQRNTNSDNKMIASSMASINNDDSASLALSYDGSNDLSIVDQLIIEYNHPPIYLSSNNYNSSKKRGSISSYTSALTLNDNEFY